MDDPLHTGTLLATRDGYDVIDCTTCGYPHLSPMPAREELESLYAEHYYDDNPGWLDKERTERAYWDLEHDDKLSDWATLLGAPTARLLDVGCSGGLLLERARERGWDTLGIEPSEHALAETRRLGLNVIPGFYEDADVPAGSVDVVHTKLVFEHLRDPAHFVRWARGVLAPGGVLSVQAPNDFNRLQVQARERLGIEPWWVAPPVHLNYFSFASVERLLSAHGFQPRLRDASFPVEWFLLMGENYVGDDVVGTAIHAKRIALETELEAAGLRRPLHRHLASQGVGRELIVHAQLAPG